MSYRAGQMFPLLRWSKTEDRTGGASRTMRSSLMFKSQWRVIPVLRRCADGMAM